MSVDVVDDAVLKETFEGLRQQVETKQSNNNACSYVEYQHEEEYYHKSNQEINYLLDKNQANTVILKMNDTYNIYQEYGKLLKRDDTVTISGWNGSIVASIENNQSEVYDYGDYGQNSTNKLGYGYNGEPKDQSGLIYLRARYYDPELGRFIQIDKDYEGEEDSTLSQNKYIYTLNNPYKYVDRSGELALADDVIIALVLSLCVAATAVSVSSSQNRQNTFINRKLNEFGNMIGNGIRGIGQAISDAAAGGLFTPHFGGPFILPGETSPVGGTFELQRQAPDVSGIPLEPETPNVSGIPLEEYPTLPTWIPRVLTGAYYAICGIIERVKEDNLMIAEGTEKTPKNPKKVSDKYLKDNGIDPHELKQDTLNSLNINEPISHYNLFVDKSGDIWLQKNGASTWIDTMVNIANGY